MPTVLNLKGYRVAVHTNDHRPAHVHVTGNDGEAEFDLHCPDGPPELTAVYGTMTKTRARKIEKGLIADLDTLCAKWREIHGDY